MNFKIKRTISFVFTLVMSFLTLVGCKNGGYDDLDVLYRDFVENFKQGGKALEDYCKKIAPDEETARYLKGNSVSYGGFPEAFDQQNLPYSVIGERYFEMVSRLRERVERNYPLNDLQYIGREENDESVQNRELGIIATETHILIKAQNDTIRLKVGEILKIDGKWKVFSDPSMEQLY